MKDFAAHNKIIICIVLLGLLIRLAFFLAARPWDEQVVNTTLLRNDARNYYDFAISILNERDFSSFADAFRIPGYPLFLAAVFFLFGHSVWVALAVQLVLDIGTVIITYRIAEALFESKRIQCIAAFLYSLSFLAAAYAVKVDWVTTFSFVFSLTILIFIRAWKESKIRWYAATGFGLGIATMIGPIAQFFPLVIGAVLVLQRRRFVAKTYSFLVMILVFLAVLAPWQLRNMHVFGHYALTTAMGRSLCRWAVPTVMADIENISGDEARSRLLGTSVEGIDNPFERSKIMRKKALEYISKNKKNYLKYYVKGDLYMFTGTAKGDILQAFTSRRPEPDGYQAKERTTDRIIKNARNEYFLTPILGTWQLLEYLFFLAGLLAMYRKDMKLLAAFFFLIILYWCAVTGVLAVSRYRVPIIPAYLVVSAKGISELVDFSKRKRSGRRSAGTACSF